MDSEILALEDLELITGRTRVGDQRDWLDTNGWAYVVNARGAPIVGREYARRRLGGEASLLAAANEPNFSAVK